MSSSSPAHKISTIFRNVGKYLQIDAAYIPEVLVLHIWP